MKPPDSSSDKRQYIRLKSVFPVEYVFLFSEEHPRVLEWQQGFTCNVSEGGICLSVHRLEPGIREHKEKVQLNLRIGIPLGAEPVRAAARVAWIEENAAQFPAKYWMGLKFVSIAAPDVRRMVRHAKWVRFCSTTAVALAGVLLVAFALLSFYSFQLSRAHQKLINDLVKIQREEILLHQNLEDIGEEKTKLWLRLERYTAETKRLDTELAAAKREIEAQSAEQTALNEQLNGYAEKIDRLNQGLETLSREKAPLENQYAALVAQENMTADQVNLVEQEKMVLQKTVLREMYRWLKNHQNSRTGLVLSFEGHIEDIRYWGFTYDQALAVDAFLLLDDAEAARKVLDFFNARNDEGFKGFLNAYYVDSGSIAEFMVHGGPNIWLGIAALRYDAKTKDNRYLPLARRIGEWLLKLQAEDPEGGLRGGPEVEWFATEHNLDGYSFFGMLYQVTGEEKFRLAQEKVLQWLKTFALFPHGQDYKSPPIKRGKGDATVATDTFAWSLAAIGPEKLAEIGMDPEEIMRFAEEHCSVKVNYKRPSGTLVEVSGFDFAKYSHLPRGGLVSPEWTAQMVVSYQMLSRYFDKKGDKAKAGYYDEKAKFYLNELSKLIITSPSLTGQGGGCLPYATLADADTGHGWRTPKGDSTGSVASTAYMIMAIKETNPLVLE